MIKSFPFPFRRTTDFWYIKDYHNILSNIDLCTLLHWNFQGFFFSYKCKYFIVGEKMLASIFDKTVTNSGTGQAIANFTGETRLSSANWKPKKSWTRHVDTEAQVEHERMDNNAKEWKTNEWKFSVGNVAIAGKRITKTNAVSPLAKIPISRIARDWERKKIPT